MQVTRVSDGNCLQHMYGRRLCFHLERKVIKRLCVPIRTALYKHACIPYSSIYLIKHTCSPKERKELGELKGRRTHQKSWRLWEKIRTSFLGIIRVLHAVNMAQLQIIRWNFWQKHIHEEGESRAADEHGKKENIVRNFIFYACLLFSLYILLNSHTHSLRTEWLRDNIFARLSHSSCVRYFVNFNGIWYASQANIHNEWQVSWKLIVVWFLAKTMIERSGMRWFILCTAHQKAPRASCSSFNKIYYTDCRKYICIESISREIALCTRISCSHSINWQLNCRSIERGDEIVSRLTLSYAHTVFAVAHS